MSKYEQVKVVLDPKENIFAMIARVEDALRKAGVSEEERDDFHDKVTFELLFEDQKKVIESWVTVEWKPNLNIWIRN